MKNIVSNLYYIGVNNRTSALFERLWSLEKGVSLNSYLILDEHITIIDTVETAFSEQFLSQIKEVIGEKEVEYLVINHMEPDHSGSIIALKRVYPNLKIVGNAKTLQMVSGYYAINDNVVEIKDGDTLCIGKERLHFHFTPMIHWPETMMTYCPGMKLLFSGDAFGCFGALDGGVTDIQVDERDYIEEMERYYAAIVAKYGEPVQSALKKLKDIELEIIAPTHGPVWMDRIESVVARYNKMSSYQCERGVVVAYGSMYGNTAQLAEEMAYRLREEGAGKVKVYDLSSADPSIVLKDIFKYKGVIFASPTYNKELFPPVREMMKKVSERNIPGHVFGFMGAFTWASAALKRFIAFADKNGWVTCENMVEMKQGYNDSYRIQIEVLAKEMCQKL